MLVNDNVTFVGTAYTDVVEVEVEYNVRVSVENWVVAKTTVERIVFSLVICSVVVLVVVSVLTERRGSSKKPPKSPPRYCNQAVH